MDRQDTEINWQDLVYFKRADLRQDEEGSPYNEDTVSDDDRHKWKYWIDNLSLHDEQDRFSAMVISDYLQVMGPADPIKIIEFFCACHEMKVYPPEWVMNEIYRRFNDYLDENYQGKGRGLGEHFDEPARGKRPGYFKQRTQERIMDIACANVHRLITWFNRIQSAALDIVAIQIEREQADVPLIARPKGRDALRRAYQTWLQAHNEVCKITGPWPDPPNEERTKFLRALGPDCLTGHPDLLAWLDKEGTRNDNVRPLRKGPQKS